LQNPFDSATYRSPIGTASRQVAALSGIFAYWPFNPTARRSGVLKVLFGSDWPVITPDRWLADFEKIDIRPEVRPLILKENAIKLLKLK